MSDRDNDFFINHDSGVGFTTVPVTEDPFERKPDQASFLKKMQEQRRQVMSVRAFMERSDAYRHPHILLSVSSRAAAENWQDVGKTITKRSRLKMPAGFNIIETQTPQLYHIFFQDDKIIELEGNDIFAAELQDPMTEFLNRQLKDARIKTKGYAYIKAMLLDGTAFAKVPYKFIEKKVVNRTKVTNPVNGEIITTKTESLEPVFDGPDVEIISIHDFFPDWTVKTPGDVQAMRGCVHRTYKTFNELKQAGIYKNLNLLETSLKTKSDKKTFQGPGKLSAPFWSTDYRDMQDKAQDNYHQAKYAGKIEVWEYWGEYDPKGDGVMEDYIIVIANGDVAIRGIENIYDRRFKPFVATPNYPRDGEFYGLPELAPQKAQIKELNQLKNARLDAINSTVNPMWKIERTAGVNLSQLVRRPDGVVLTNDNNGLQRLQDNDTTPTSAQEIAQLQESIMNTSAIGLANTSSGKAFARTSGGVDFLSSFADNRIKLKAAILSETFFQPVSKIFQDHNRQFVTEDKVFPFSNPDLNQADPEAVLPIEAFNLEFAYKTRTDFETGGVEGFLGKMEAITPFIIAGEQSQPGTFKIDQIGQQVLRKLLGPSGKRFTRSDEERLQLQQQQLAAEQAANAEAGARAPQPNASSEIIDDNQTTPEELAELQAEINV